MYQIATQDDDAVLLEIEQVLIERRSAIDDIQVARIASDGIVVIVVIVCSDDKSPFLHIQRIAGELERLERRRVTTKHVDHARQIIELIACQTEMFQYRKQRQCF